MFSDTTSQSDENQASGLWLWHGKAALPPSPLQPASHVPQIPGPNVPALRRRGWMALPGGVALALLAVMLRSTPLDKPPSADTPAVALEPVPSPTEAHAVIPAPPVNISAPRVEHTDTQFDQAQMPSADYPRDRARRRTTHQREPREKPTHSLAKAHHLSSTECSRRRIFRWLGMMAVTERFQRDVSRTDDRARSRLLT